MRPSRSPAPGRPEFRPLSCLSGRVLAVAARSARAFPRHSHDRFGIGLILSGAQASASGRGPVTAGPGALITVNPGEVHDGRPIGGARAWRMLYLDPDLVAAARAALAPDLRTGQEFTAPVLDRPGLARLFARLYRAATAGESDTGRMAFDAALAEALVLLCGGDDRGRRPPPPAPVARARDFLHDRQDGPVALAELAAVAGISPWHLSRRFAAEFGLPPHAYLVQLRLAAARRLIAGCTPLSATVAEAGFADQSHLTRLFRRQFGYTPADFARASHPRAPAQEHSRPAPAPARS